MKIWNNPSIEALDLSATLQGVPPVFNGDGYIYADNGDVIVPGTAPGWLPSGPDPVVIGS